MRMIRGLILGLAVGAAACSSTPQSGPAEAPGKTGEARPAALPGKRQSFVLAVDKFWRVETPEGKRFDASALLLTRHQELLTVNDKSPELQRIELGEGETARLASTGLFVPRQVRAVAVARPGAAFDFEGIAEDGEGRLYLCEEQDRAIYRFNRDSKTIERFAVDWASVRSHFGADRNASFEGIAVGGGHIYLANERSQPRLIVLDFETRQVTTNFLANGSGFAVGGTHYSDLSWFEGHLYALDRNHRSILQIDPAAQRVVAEYSFAQMEIAPEHIYKTQYPTGTMEGLAVEADYFWLITDNNGLGRQSQPEDIRPTLFRCQRPR